MLVVFPLIFVAGIEIIYGCNFAAFLKFSTDILPDQTISTKPRISKATFIRPCSVQINPNLPKCHS